MFLVTSFRSPSVMCIDTPWRSCPRVAAHFTTAAIKLGTIDSPFSCSLVMASNVLPPTILEYDFILINLQMSMEND